MSVPLRQTSIRPLKESVEYAKTHTVQETHDKVVADINAVEGLEVEYFQIVDGDSLQDVSSWEDSAYVVGGITVYCGRLLSVSSTISSIRDNSSIDILY